MTNPSDKISFFNKKSAALIPLAVGVFLGLSYALALCVDFDFTIGHFNRPSLFFALAVAAAALGALCALSPLLFTGRKIYDPLPAPSPRSAFGAVLAACMCLLLFVSGFGAGLSAFAEEGVSPGKLNFFAALFGLCLAASVVLNLFPSQRGGQPLPAVLALLGALSVNLAMFAAYFDFSIPLNSPVRNFTTLTQASMLLFLLSEARLAIVKEPKELPVPFQLFTETAATVFGVGIGGGGALYYLYRAFQRMGEYAPLFGSNEPNLPLARLVLYLALGILARDRLLAATKNLRDLTLEEIEEAERKAKEEKEKKKRKSGAVEESKK